MDRRTAEQQLAEVELELAATERRWSELVHLAPEIDRVRGRRRILARQVQELERLIARLRAAEASNLA